MSNGQGVRLGEIVAPRLGSIDPSRHPDESFVLYSIPAFECGAPERLQGRDIGSAKQVVQPGDVLLSRIIPHIRRAWVVGSDPTSRTIASNEWLVFRNERIYPDYLRHVLVGDRFHSAFMTTVSGVGGSLLRAKSSYVAEITIPLPPLAEQRRIAALLERADGVRQKREESRRLVNELLRSVFLEMFGDPVRNEKGWEVVRMGAVINRIEAGTSIGGEERLARAGEWSVLKVSAVTSRSYRPEEAKVVSRPPRLPVVPEPGDLLFSRANTRELVAATCIVDQYRSHTFLPDKIWRVSTDVGRLSPVYLHFVLGVEGIRRLLTRQATGTSGSMFNVSQSKFLALPVPLPPIEVQARFGAVAVACNRLIGRVQRTGHEAGSLGGTLSTELLSTES